MLTEERPLTKRERTELAGYVSGSGVLGRAVLFAVAVGIVAVLARRIQQATPLDVPLWPAVPLAFGAFLFIRAKRWTGGSELRSQVRRDLQDNVALVHQVRCHDAVIFEEAEDEGPIVFVQAQGGETLVFTGQALARHVRKGFPWSAFEIRETKHSRRFLGLDRNGESRKAPAARPPLSRQAYTQLDLDSVRTWKRLDVSFEDVKSLS